MGRLLSWFNMIIKKRRELKRWQRVVTVLAAMITFATTYALILPAITVEKDTAAHVGGMYLEHEDDQEELLEENALEFTGVSIAADQNNAVTYEQLHARRDLYALPGSVSGPDPGPRSQHLWSGQRNHHCLGGGGSLCAHRRPLRSWRRHEPAGRPVDGRQI